MLSGVLIGRNPVTGRPDSTRLHLGTQDGRNDTFSNLPLSCGFRADTTHSQYGDSDIISTLMGLTRPACGSHRRSCAQGGSDSVFGGDGGDAISSGAALDFILGDHGSIQVNSC